MTASALDNLAAYIERHATDTVYRLAFSGGMDSQLLLSLLVELRAQRPMLDVSAIHVDHALHPDSGFWAKHCEVVCTAFGVPLSIRRVKVDADNGGPESTARAARYRAFAEELGAGEHLLLAQHADDQAETFLLQALRGSGPDGLAGIPLKRHFQGGFMARPLLSLSRDQLREEACARKLLWIEDPSNRDLSLDRNYLRHAVIPRLRERWPSLERTLGRAASRSAAASRHVEDCARADLARLEPQESPYGSYLSIKGLATLSRERRHAALRTWFRTLGLRMPRLADLEAASRTLVEAADGSAGIVSLGDHELRRHRDRLYCIHVRKSVAAFQIDWFPATNPILEIAAADVSLDSAWLAARGLVIDGDTHLVVRSRRGGELIQLGEPAFHKAVKKLLQEASVPPWERERIPLIYRDGQLVAVWGLAVAATLSGESRPMAVPHENAADEPAGPAADDDRNRSTLPAKRGASGEVER